MTRTILLLALILSAPIFAEVCKTTESEIAGLPNASCYMPMCNNKVNCDPPEVFVSSAKIFYNSGEGMDFKFKQPCPDPDKNKIFGNCWLVTLPYHFEVDAKVKNNDPTSHSLFVTKVGINLVSAGNTDDNLSHYQKYLNDVASPAESGHFSVDGVITTYVPVGGRLDLHVYELCARDSEGNQGCSLPPNVKAFDYNLENR